MIQKIFGVRDSKALAFLQPFFGVTAGVAIRAFEEAVNDGKSPISKHPEDYVLYELADFDDSTGEVISVVPIKALGCGRDYVKVANMIGDLANASGADLASLRRSMEREVVGNGK